LEISQRHYLYSYKEKGLGQITKPFFLMVGARGFEPPAPAPPRSGLPCSITIGTIVF
jgi:hypothetical protein